MNRQLIQEKEPIPAAFVLSQLMEAPEDPRTPGFRKKQELKIYK